MQLRKMRFLLFIYYFRLQDRSFNEIKSLKIEKYTIRKNIKNIKYNQTVFDILVKWYVIIFLYLYLRYFGLNLKECDGKSHYLTFCSN